MNSLLPLKALAVSVLLAGLASGSAMAQQTNQIEYRKQVTLKVGDSVVIHGIRGECGSLPAASKLKNRQLKTGTITYGAKGIRNSRSCGGPTPAVEVIFTATMPGKERFKVEGDSIQVTVVD